MKLRPNLANAHAEQLTISASLALPEEAISRLHLIVTSVGQAPDMPWLFSEAYSITRNRHGIRASLAPIPGEGKYHFNLVFLAEEIELFPDEPKVSLFLETISTHSSSVRYHCTAQFEYSPEMGESRVAIPLEPLRTGERIEVRGARVTSVDEQDREKFSIVIDRPTLKNYFHSVTLHADGEVKKESIDHIFRDAVDISRRYFELPPGRSRRSSQGE